MTSRIQVKLNSIARYWERAINGFITESVVIESVDSISRDERDVPLTQYITNA